MANDEIKPYIPAEETSLAELTVQAVVLGLILSVVLCAANVYVGLYAGMTVSAAIPASVISMAVLRGMLRRGTILENNVVHTVASSGESLAAGIIFTVPALVLLKLPGWESFRFWETTLIAMAGGVMGVVMMIPLRKAMIIDQPELRYPEGVACAEVLKAGDRGGSEMFGIFVALAIGGLFKALVSVVGLFRGSVEWGWRMGRTGVYFGTDISPMLVAVGFIVGWEVSLLVFLGGAISFFGAIPVLAWGTDFGDGSVVEALMTVWDEKIRYFGIGAMIVAGLFSIVKISGSMGSALKTAIRGIRGREESVSLPRTEQGISGRLLFALLVASVVLSGIVYYLMTRSAVQTAFISVIMFVLAFFFVAVASYIVGLVGSSNSPVSGMTICTVLLTAFMLLIMGYTGAEGMVATLGVAGVVCCAACTSGDICQDLKIGQIVGATPKRLQTGEIIGTVASAFIIAPTMVLLHNAYGIGTGEPGSLKAPQGVMFSKLVGGFFGAETIPWNLVGWGAAVGVVAILIDRIYLQPRNARFRLHAMPMAVGMYLPLTVTTPILIGGVMYYFVERRSLARGDSPEQLQEVTHRGLLFSSGLVAGEAIMGILIAMLVMAKLDMPLMKDWASGGAAVDLVSVAGLSAVMALLVRKAFAKGRSAVSN